MTIRLMTNHPDNKLTTRLDSSLNEKVQNSLICPVCGTGKKRWRAASLSFVGIYRCSNCKNWLRYRTRKAPWEIFSIMTLLIALPFIFEQFVLFSQRYNDLASFDYFFYPLVAPITALTFHFFWTYRFLDKDSLRLRPKGGRTSDKPDPDPYRAETYKGKIRVVKYSFEIILGAFVVIQILNMFEDLVPNGRVKDWIMELVVYTGIGFFALIVLFIFVMINVIFMSKIQSAARNTFIIGFIAFVLIWIGTIVTFMHMFRVESNFAGQAMERSFPVMLNDPGPWKDASAIVGTTVAIKKNGTLWQWGSPSTYFSSKPTKQQRPNPIQILEAKRIDKRDGWIDVDGGRYHFVALHSDGSLWSWGINEDGQLGSGSTRDASTPKQVTPGRHYATVSAGLAHTLAIDASGTLWAWGENRRGSLGDGSSNDAYAPISIASGQQWKTVEAGGNFSVAIKDDGTLWAWGENSSRQVGSGLSKNQFTPLQISSNDSWETLCVGYEFGCAVKKDGTIWTWGDDTFTFSLDEGNDPINPVPTLFKTNDLKVKQAAGGSGVLYVLDTKNRLWVAGNHSVMQIFDLGYGRELRRFLDDPGFEMISNGFNNGFGIDNAGRLWVWGDNMGGKLGDFDHSRDSLAATVKSLYNGLLKRTIENLNERDAGYDLE